MAVNFIMKDDGSGIAVELDGTYEGHIEIDEEDGFQFYCRQGKSLGISQQTMPDKTFYDLEELMAAIRYLVGVERMPRPDDAEAPSSAPTTTDIELVPSGGGEPAPAAA